MICTAKIAKLVKLYKSDATNILIQENNLSDKGILPGFRRLYAANYLYWGLSNKFTLAEPTKNQQNKLFRIIKLSIHKRFNLHLDKADEDDVVLSIKKNSDFVGANLWTLIFAIFIASIGLNVNSTAVIIGAMLISPLMGPIMGIGLGIGTNDFELVKKGLRNLLIATLISIVASTIYFYITPLHDAQSELLARTTPSIWDVFIAFFGGLAGIVAGTRKEKSNVIPGVAIATALMPPLCTAGFGLASGNFYFFIGAIYLYFINSVFICISTFLIVRFLKFKKKHFEDKNYEKKGFPLYSDHCSYCSSTQYLSGLRNR